MRGFLRCSDTILSLAPKITTIGRDNCDITIQSTAVDLQHALVEFCEEENCFVLQDLNSATGTYVNDTRVQNAAVRLAPFDQIRFGFGGTVYQLELEDGGGVPPRAWGASNSSITRNPYMHVEDQSLPQIPPNGIATPPVWANQQQASLPHPPPASLRSRPLSAGTRRQSSDSNAPPVVRGTWVTPSGGSPSCRSAGSSPTHDLLSLQQDKEQKIMRMGDEINRLAAFEQDNERKNALIEQLTTELAQLKQASRKSPVQSKSDEKLAQLQTELQTKKTEIASLKDKLKAKPNRAQSDGMDQAKLQELHSVKAELERVKKDKNIISGLVSQTQRDMSTKDTSISRLTREIEQLKKDVRNRDVQIATLGSKMSRVKENSQSEGENEARDRELVGLRLQFKNAENKIQELTSSVKTLKGELERRSNRLSEGTAEQMKLTSEVQHAKAEFLDMQRAERSMRVDLEQATKRAERFRNRVIQVAFSTPGVKYPDEEVKDETLMESLKKIIDERTNLQKQITELKEQIKQLTGAEKKGEKALKAMKTHLGDSMGRIRDKGLLSSQLKQELSLLQSISITGAPESLQSIKENLVNMMQAQVNWQQETEDALEKCGIKVKLSNDPPAKHITELFSKWELAIKEKDGAESNIKLQEGHHKAELATQAANLRQEMMDKVADAVDKAKSEADDRLNRAIEDLRAVEQERREAAIEMEKRKLEEVESNMAALRQSLVDQQEEQKDKLDSANEALRTLEDYKKLEETLKAEMVKIEQEKLEAIAAIKNEYDAKEMTEAENLGHYREQIKQHSVTICSMEERLNKSTKKAKNLTQENSSLKQKIQELQSKPQHPVRRAASPPTKPKVIIQKEPIGPEVTALQQTIATMRQECMDYKRMHQEQQNVILGLKKDLAGAEARLSDMTGEIPEAHKMELEKNRALIRERTKEVTELQQQLAKLSAIIDSKSSSSKKAESDIGVLQNKLEKFERDAASKDDVIRNLEMKLLSANETHTEQAKQMEDETKISQELSCLGQACRGERHQLVIERQREALAELRRRIKELELMRPAGGKGGNQAADAALKQVDLLKRELAEMRSGNMVDDKTMQDLASMTAVDRAVNKARGITAVSDAEVDHERSAHRETHDALDESEKSYLTLLRGVASCLDLEEVGGMSSMTHIPRDERQRLADERETITGTLTTKIQALRERLNRKDELLRNYERDLAKLRQAELLVEKKSQQVDELVNDVQGRLDEAMYLRATLDRTKDRLHQEKRLNTAIKQKKTFHLENEKGPFVTNGRHACPPDDLLAKEAAKKKKQIERIRRKNYEIKTLKSELHQKHTELCHTTTRLANMENDELVGGAPSEGEAELMYA